MNLFNPNNPYNTMYPYNNYNTASQAVNGIIWVQGIEGAKAYQLQPNSNAILMDSENDETFYIKVSDNVGMCNLRVFKYKEQINNPSTIVNPDEYVKKNDLKTEVETIVNSIIGEKSNEQSISTAKSTKVITK